MQSVRLRSRRTTGEGLHPCHGLTVQATQWLLFGLVSPSVWVAITKHQTGGLINNRNSVLIVLKTGKSKMVPKDVVPGKGLLLGSCVFLLCPHVAEEVRQQSGVSLLRALPSGRALPF